MISAVDVPVLAAGGIGTGQAMWQRRSRPERTACASGPDSSPRAEAAVHPEYVAALIGAEAQDTAFRY